MPFAKIGTGQPARTTKVCFGCPSEGRGRKFGDKRVAFYHQLWEHIGGAGAGPGAVEYL